MRKALGKYTLVLEKEEETASKHAAAAPRATAAPSAAATPKPAKETQRSGNAEALALVRWISSDYETRMMSDLSRLDSSDKNITTSQITNGLTGIWGEDTYTAYLNFSGTEKGYSNDMSFCALTILNGEVIHPGWVIDIDRVKLNDTAVPLRSKPYTCTDESGRHTQVYLYNPWSTGIPENARVNGGLDGADASPLSPDSPGMKNLKKIEITFTYGPAKMKQSSFSN